MSECLNVEMRDLLPDYVHGTLDGAERARVAAHLESCAPCRAELELIVMVRRALGAHGPVVDTGRIVAALPQSSRRSVWRIPAMRIAASIAIVALGGASFALSRGGFVGSPADTASASASGAAERGLSLGGRLNDLDDADLSALLERVRELDGIPVVEPRAVLVPISMGSN